MQSEKNAFSAISAIKVLDPTERFDAWVLIVWSMPIPIVLASFKSDEMKMNGLVLYAVVFAGALFYSFVKKRQIRELRDCRLKHNAMLERAKAIGRSENEALSKNLNDLVAIKEELYGLRREITHTLEKNKISNDLFEGVQHQMNLITANIDSKIQSFEGRLGELVDYSKLMNVSPDADLDMRQYVEQLNSLSKSAK